VDDLDVEPLAGFLDHDVLRDFGKIGQIVERLPQRRGREREGAILAELGAHLAIMLALVRGRSVRGVLGTDALGVLEFRPGRQAVGLDDAGVAHLSSRWVRKLSRSRSRLSRMKVLS